MGLLDLLEAVGIEGHKGVKGLLGLLEHSLAMLIRPYGKVGTDCFKLLSIEMCIRDSVCSPVDAPLCWALCSWIC